MGSTIRRGLGGLRVERPDIDRSVVFLVMIGFFLNLIYEVFHLFNFNVSGVAVYSNIAIFGLLLIFIKLRDRAEALIKHKYG